jgi:hypothetical protein
MQSSRLRWKPLLIACAASLALKLFLKALGAIRICMEENDEASGLMAGDFAHL